MKTRVPLHSPGGSFLRVPEGPSNSLLGESVGEVHLSCHCDELEVSGIEDKRQCCSQAYPN